MTRSGRPVRGPAPTAGERMLRHRYAVLVVLRWLPAGLTAPLVALLPLERGLTLAQVGVVVAVQGLVVLALELPTGALADTLGRRPVLLLATVTGTAALVALAVADTVAGFVLASALRGVWRALDSGPLEAWFVDAVLAERADADVTAGLSAGALALNVAMGAGALASGGIVALARAAGSPAPALVLPVVVAALVSALSLVAVARLVREPPERVSGTPRGRPRARAALGQAPGAVADGLRLLRRSPVLLALVLVEVSWGFGMVAFETLVGPRLGEVAGGIERAAVLLGPVTSAAWLAAAAGAGLVPALSRRLGDAGTAAVLRVTQGATVIGMGVLAGPVGVVAAFVACYAAHGASNPVHNALLHREAGPANRTVVLSMNSMVAQPAFAVGSLVLGAVADRASPGAAMLVAAGVLAAGAAGYLPAWRRDRPGADGRLS